MAGSPVDRNLLDAKASEAVVQVREAFRQVRTVQTFLANQSNLPDGTDPLSTGAFDYTADEIYLLRRVFGDLSALEVQPILDIGRKLTGLQ